MCSWSSSMTEMEITPTLLHSFCDVCCNIRWIFWVSFGGAQMGWVIGHLSAPWWDDELNDSCTWWAHKGAHDNGWTRWAEWRCVGYPMSGLSSMGWVWLNACLDSAHNLYWFQPWVRFFAWKFGVHPTYTSWANAWARWVETWVSKSTHEQVSEMRHGWDKLGIVGTWSMLAWGMMKGRGPWHAQIGIYIYIYIVERRAWREHNTLDFAREEAHEECQPHQTRDEIWGFSLGKGMC